MLTATAVGAFPPKALRPVREPPATHLLTARARGSRAGPPCAFAVFGLQFGTGGLEPTDACCIHPVTWVRLLSVYQGHAVLVTSQCTWIQPG